MSENTNKNLVGQPILPQILDLVSKIKFRGLVKEHDSDRYYKKFNTWTHFVSMMFGIFSRCYSVTEIVEGMIGCVGDVKCISCNWRLTCRIIHVNLSAERNYT